MPETDLSVEAVGKLDARQLVGLLDRLDANDPGIAELDLDVIAGAIDPKRLRRTEMTTLLAAIARLADAGTGVDLGTVGAHTFARLLTRASKDQVASFMAEPPIRALVLDEVFLRRMPAHLRADRAQGVDATVHWRISGGTGEGGYDRYETVIKDGECASTRAPSGTVRTTITASPADFLRLITMQASAPVLFLTGKLKVRGDLAFAAGLTGFFDLPKA